MQAVHLDATILDAVLRLIGAYVVIRVGVLLFAAEPRQQGSGCATSRTG